MADTIISADKKFKKQVIITLAILLPVCVGIFIGSKIYFQQIPDKSDVAGLIGRVKSAILWISIANGVISAWLSTRLFSLSIKTFNAGQFPPPGVRVIRDTKVRTGKHAGIFGGLLAVAAILVLSTNLLLFFLHQTIDNLMRQLTLY